MNAQISKLSRLRKRFGNAIVDAVRSNQSDELICSGAEQMVAWAPARPPSAFPNDDVEQLQAQQLIQKELPDLVGDLGAEVLTARRSEDGLLNELLGLGAIVYPALLLHAELASRKEGNFWPLHLAAAGEGANKALIEAGLFGGHDGRKVTYGVSSFGSYESISALYRPADLAIHAAWELCLLRGTWTAGDLGRALAENLDRLRLAQAGGPTTPLCQGSCRLS